MKYVQYVHVCTAISTLYWLCAIKLTAYLFAKIMLRVSIAAILPYQKYFAIFRTLNL